MKTSAPLYDLIVIGSGPAGHRAALQGSKAGKKVAIIESEALGGGCVHYGTLPSKSLRESVYRYSLGSRGVLGSESDEHAKKSVNKKSNFQVPEMNRLVRRKDRVVAGETRVIQDQLKRNGIKIYSGHAFFVNTHEIEVRSKKGVERISAEIVIIAVGARPIAPSPFKVDGKIVLDSDTVFNLKQIPQSMVVLGGGIIGCEYASMFSMAGTEVTLVDRRHEILASVDREIVQCLVDRFEHRGVEVILGTEASEIESKTVRGKKKALVHLTNGRKINADVVLVAQGRFGNTENLGLENIGVKPDERGLLKVDKNFKTSAINVYAVGDVIGAPALASTSMEQGRIATCHAFGIKTATKHEMPALYPYGIYTIPEISMIGRTEEELKALGVDYISGKARYCELARGQIVGDRWGLLKLLVDRKTLQILGVHIVGDSAADLIHIGQAVMALGGAVTYFIDSVFNYPTFAEAYKNAAFHAVNQIQGTTRTR